MVSLELGKSDEWTDDSQGALHPLSAAEYQVSQCNEVTIQAIVQFHATVTL